MVAGASVAEATPAPVTGVPSTGGESESVVVPGATAVPPVPTDSSPRPLSSPHNNAPIKGIPNNSKIHQGNPFFSVSLLASPVGACTSVVSVLLSGLEAVVRPAAVEASVFSCWFNSASVLLSGLNAVVRPAIVEASVFSCWFNPASVLLSGLGEVTTSEEFALLTRVLSGVTEFVSVAGVAKPVVSCWSAAATTA